MLCGLRSRLNRMLPSSIDPIDPNTSSNDSVIEIHQCDFDRDKRKRLKLNYLKKIFIAAFGQY